MGMVEGEGEVEEVVEADADGDGFEAEGFEGEFIGEGVVHVFLRGEFWTELTELDEGKGREGEEAE